MIPKLVVFDTWTLNCDRYPPDLTKRKPNYDNVFLSAERAPSGKFEIVAMDHTHCFTCGRSLNERIATIGRIKDERVYGLFPEFIPQVRAGRDTVMRGAELLRRLNSADCDVIVDSIPTEWEVSAGVRKALARLVYERARFVADNIIDRLAPSCWPQQDFDFEKNGDA